MVGFALETSNLEERAAAKLQAKNLDFIVANDPTAPGSGFGPTEHSLTLLGREGSLWRSPTAPKPDLAGQLLDRLAEACGWSGSP